MQKIAKFTSKTNREKSKRRASLKTAVMIYQKRKENIVNNREKGHKLVSTIKSRYVNTKCTKTIAAKSKRNQ